MYTSSWTLKSTSRMVGTKQPYTSIYADVDGGPHLKRFFNKCRQGNATTIYIDSETEQNNTVHDCRSLDVVFPALMAKHTSTPLKLERCFVGNQIVSTIYDSGANVLEINERLVLKSAYTGRYVRCRTLSGHVEKCAQCRMFIKTIYYTGDAELLYPTKTSGRSGNRTAKVRKKMHTPRNSSMVP